jgi:hypothetical protein
VDDAGRSVRPSVVLDVPDSRVEREVLDHALVRVEVDRVKAGVAGRGFGVLEKGPADAGPLL